MQIMRWDRKAIAEDFSDCTVFEEIIAELESSLISKGEVICEIRVNETYLDIEEEKRLAGSAVTDIEDLEVRSEKTAVLISSSVVSLFEWIPQVRDVSIMCSEYYREGETVSANKYFQEILESCEWITEALGLLRPELFKISDDVQFIDKWDVVKTKYMDSVQELLEAYQAKDLVLLADVLEYEITTALDNWLELLKSDDKILSIIGE